MSAFYWTRSQVIFFIYFLDIEDVNKALQEIHKDLEKKSYKDDVHNIASDQAIINESLCTENIVARWLWKSGEVKQGSLVPWEM